MLASFLFIALPAIGQRAHADHLQTDFTVDPSAAGTMQPRLSWWGHSSNSDAFQLAFQVRIWKDQRDSVSADPVWDSGKVTSRSQMITLRDTILAPRSSFVWRVRLWDGANLPGPWSEPARFGIGPLTPQDWLGAQWIAFRDNGRWRAEWKQRKAEEFEKYKVIGLTPVVTSAHMTSWQLLDSVQPRYDPSPLLRKHFDVTKPIRTANLYISGLGYSVEWINGHRLGSAVLDPGWTNYQHDVLYRTFDVTSQLQSGRNALGVMLGRGFFGMLANDRWGFAQHAPWIAQPTVKALLDIEYQDGHHDIIKTDETWKVTGGPVLYDDPWLGEVYDARQEQNGWTEEPFDDSLWDRVHRVPGPAGILRQQEMPPIRPAQSIQPISQTQVSPGVWLLDMGMNTAGWMALTLNGTAGDKALIQMAEKPDKDTFSDQTTGNFQQMGYILKGGGDEVAQAHFSYMGFRYVRITLTSSTDRLPLLKRAEAIPVHTQVASAGSFESSNSLLNQIDAMWRRTQLNNMESIPTDCPHREKLGWLADSYVGLASSLYSFNAAAFYENFSVDVANSANKHGLLPTFSPSYQFGDGRSPLWASAEVLIPWRLYLYVGDRAILRSHYSGIQRFLDATIANNVVPGKPYLIKDALGDWDSPGYSQPPEGQEPYSTAYYFLDCQIAARMAMLLDKPADAAKFNQRAALVKAAFQRWFYAPQQGIYHGLKPTEYRQSLNALALSLGLVPKKFQGTVYQNLRRDVVARNNHLNTGILGTGPLLEVLASHGDVDLAYRIATQTTYPSWGFMLANGATTMWEAWDGMSSLDHPMQGVIVEFLYSHLAGIRPDDAHPGFTEFNIQPIFPQGLTHAEAHFDSQSGAIESSWTRSHSQIALHITVPFNTTAHVSLPSLEGHSCSVMEGTTRRSTSQNSLGPLNSLDFNLGSGQHALELSCP